MPVNITSEDKGKYLSFDVKGSKSLEDGIALWKEIGRITQEKGHSKILVIEDIDTPLCDIEIVEIVSHFREAGLARVKIAYIDVNTDSQSGIKLGELVANNNGFTGCVFNDTDEAVAWLQTA